MSRSAIDALRARAEQIRARRKLVAWELRQSAHAKGAFDRLGLALARAERALAIAPLDAETLAGEGWPRDAGGADLHPPIAVFFVDAERAARLTDARPLAMRIDAAMLASRAIALVPFAAHRALRR